MKRHTIVVALLALGIVACGRPVVTGSQLAGPETRPTARVEVTEPFAGSVIEAEPLDGRAVVDAPADLTLVVDTVTIDAGPSLSRRMSWVSPANPLGYQVNVAVTWEDGNPGEGTAADVGFPGANQKSISKSSLRGRPTVSIYVDKSKTFIAYVTLADRTVGEFTLVGFSPGEAAQWVNDAKIDVSALVSCVSDGRLADRSGCEPGSRTNGSLGPNI